MEDGEKFVVSFDTDGGSSILPIEVKQNEKVVKPTTPTKEGYVFLTWQLDGVDFDFNTPIIKNITLIATWEEKKMIRN